MASSVLANRVRVATATSGTGTATLGAKVSNKYATFAEAGITNGQVVTYTIEDGSDWEVGRGTYTSAGTTLSRDTVLISSIAGTVGTSKLNLSGVAEVFISAAKEDLDVNDFTEDTAPDIAADFVWMHDTSAALKKKVKPTNFLSWALIQSQAASASAQLDFETGLDDTLYDAFELRLSNLVPDTDQVQLQLQVKVGGSYQTTGYLAGIFAVTSAASTAAGSSTAAILVNRASDAGGVGNASGENISGVARFSNPEGTTDLMMVEVQSAHRRADAAGESAFGGGFYNTAGAVTGIRVKFDSGNIASGRVSLYGLKKA
jgi:hypothetical protein